MKVLIVLAFVAAASASGRYDREYDYGANRRRYQVSYSKTYTYHGKYGGKCDSDGLYYRNDASFVFCTNGNSYVQPCAPGTRNGAFDSFTYGGSYGYNDFCSVNLVDYGYGAKSRKSYGPDRGYEVGRKVSYGYEEKRPSYGYSESHGVRGYGEKKEYSRKSYDTGYGSYGKERGYGKERSYGKERVSYGYSEPRKERGYGYKKEVRSYGVKDDGYGGPHRGGYGDDYKGYGYQEEGYGYGQRKGGYHDDGYGKDKVYRVERREYRGKSYGDDYPKRFY